MPVKRRGGDTTSNGRQRATHRLTPAMKGKKTARPTAKRKGKGVKDVDLSKGKHRDAWDLSEALLYTRVPGAPAIVDLLKDRDRWITPTALPVLSEHFDIEMLTQLAWQLAQGWTLKQFMHLTGLPRETIDRCKPEIAYLRNAGGALLFGMLKTRLWVRAVVGGDVHAAKAWADLTGLAPEKTRKVQLDPPLGGLPVRDVTPGRDTPALPDDRATTDLLVRKLATLYQRERAVRDLQAVPEAPRVAGDHA